LSFKDDITQSLKYLSRKQLCQFAWLCGLRVLPFLSVKRGFAYWPENKRQEHLYSIFQALDLSAQSLFIDDFDPYAPYAYAAYASASASAASASAYASSSHAFSAGATFAANAAATAAFSARAASATTSAKTKAAAASAASAAASAASSSIFNLKGFLLDDIEKIMEKRLNVCNHDTSVYGKLWDDFQEDLNAIGCAYWVRFFEDLFNNGFEINKKQLERHFSIPVEIKAGGAAAVGRFLEGLGDKIERLNEARIIILGEKGAGKTSLAKKLGDINAPMPERYESTEGVETRLWDFPDKDGVKNVTAHIWDFAGDSITHSAHRCFMSARCLYIYVYNGRIERDNDPAYWLEQLRIHGGDSPVLFLVNEEGDRKADIAEKTLKKDYPSIVGYYHVDIAGKDKTKLKEFRRTVMDMVRNNPSWNNQFVSVEAYKIKDKLRELFRGTKSPHITREQFDKIAKNCGAQVERIEEILEDLHTLGICLWYNKDEMEDFNMLVLNPDWITNGIYRIININKNKEKSNKHIHILTLQKGTAILSNDKRYEYPRDKVAFLFKLMKVYELAFFETKDRIFIPGILPLDRPDILPPTFDDANGRLTMSFVVDKVLPPNIVSRIIVRRSDEISDENLLWRKGAVLKYKDGNATALIVEDTRSITVRVKGEDKTPYIASLRETIKNIFDSYKVIKPDLLYEVLIPEEAKANDSIMIYGEQDEPLMLFENVINDFIKWRQDYPHGNIKIPLDRTAQEYLINMTFVYTSNVEKVQVNTGGTMDNHSINFNDSPLTNSPVTGVMINSNQTVTVNKPDIEAWLQKVIDELEKNNIRDDELTSAIETLQAIIQAPNPSGKIIKSAVEMIKSIGINIVSSAVWQSLMAHPPM
jgi:GTPase SAR1 family protein